MFLGERGADKNVNFESESVMLCIIILQPINFVSLVIAFLKL